MPITNIPTAVAIALSSAALFFLVGQLTGLWKYWHMSHSENASTPRYVNVAHNTSLMYSYACLVLAAMAYFSAWSSTINIWATSIPILFFASAVAGYALHGWLQDTSNQLKKPHKIGNTLLPPWLIPTYMTLLVIGEVGGTLILLCGMFKTLW